MRQLRKLQRLHTSREHVHAPVCCVQLGKPSGRWRREHRPCAPPSERALSGRSRSSPTAADDKKRSPSPAPIGAQEVRSLLHSKGALRRGY
jgi:hypothetical protein